MESCDALLMLGTDFPYRPFYPRRKPASRRSTSAPPRSAIAARSTSASLATIRETAAALLPLLDEKMDSAHLDAATADYKKTRANLDALAVSDPKSEIIHPQYLTRLVSELAAEDAIFTCDVGTPVAWAARYLKMNGRRRWLDRSTTARWRTRCCTPSARRRPSRGGRSSRFRATAGSR